MKLRPLERRSAEQMAAGQLRQQITAGDLLPGSRLTETGVAETLGVSRGTLRIALHQLSKEGLVIQTPYTGWSVVTLAPDDVWELYTLRSSFESMAARLLCNDLSAVRRKSVEVTYQKLVSACNEGTYSRIAERDFELHQAIVQLSGHVRLGEHYKLVEQQIRIFVSTTYHLVASPQSVIEHHEPIVAAILRGDGPAACGLIEEHATSEGQKLHAFLMAQNAQNSYQTG
jgi:DNA-binding GntR family transcriptional regulator